MRVVSGSARGCKLSAPEGMDTRPTTDRIKETLFNIIAPEIYDCRFLDIFSGSGAIGIEALSRGAAKAVFVENAKNAINAIEANIEKTRLGERAEILKLDAESAINMLSRRNEKFDIIFMDPPYRKGLGWSAMKAVKAGGLLSENGIIIVEEASDAEIPEIEGFNMYRTKDYKTTVMSFWTLEDNND